MSGMDRYYERKKEKSNALTTSPAKSGMDRYYENKYYKSLNINNDFINSFISDTNNFLGSAEEAYKGITWGNASSTYDSQYATWKDLDTRAKAINWWLEHNKSNIDEDSYNSLSDTLKSVSSGTSSVIDAFKGYKDYYSQWETEDDYNSAIKSQKDYEDLLSFDLESGKVEINNLESIANVKKQIAEIEAENQTLELAKAKGSKDAIAKLEENKKRLPILNNTWEHACEVYGGEDELKALLSQKKQYYTLAERAQNAVALTEDALKATDFEQYAQIGANIENPSFNNARIDKSNIWSLLFDKDIENIVTFARDNKENLNTMGAMSSSSGDVGIVESYLKYTFMTNDEVKVYNYYLGKGDTKKAEEYLTSLEDTLNSRRGAQIFDNVEDNTFLEYVFGVSAGLDQFSTGIINLFSNEDYIPTTSTQYASGMIRDDLEDTGIKLPDWTGGASLGQVGYDMVTTTSNMLPSILVSYIPYVGQVAGPALLGASAAGNAKSEMLRLGYSKEQANTYGLLVGASEGALQYLLGGISKLGGKASGNIIAKIVDKIDNGLARTAITLGGNMVSEGVEEVLQSILEPYFKAAVTYEDLEGIDWAEVVYSGLLGMMSAGLLEGGPTVINAGINANRAKNIYGDSTAELITEALEINPDNAYAAKLKERLDSGKSLTGTQINRIVEMNENVLNDSKATANPSQNETLTVSEEQPYEAQPTKESADESKTADETSANTVLEIKAPSSAPQVSAQQEKNTVTTESPTEKENATEGKNEALESDEETDDSENTVTLAEASKKYGAQAQAMIHTYTEGQNVAKYDNAYKAAYDMGMSGVSLSYVKNSNTTAYLTETQKELAYEAGRAAADNAAKEQDKKNKSLANGKTGRKKGTVKGEGVTVSDLKKAFNDTQNKAYKILSSVAEATGIDIVLYKSDTDADGNFIGSQGKFKWSEDKIYIDINAGLRTIYDVDDLAQYAMLRTFSHEFTHFIEKWNPIWYNEFRKAVFDTLSERGENVHELIEIKKAMNEDMSYDMASRELVAEAMTDILPDASFIETLATKHKNIFEKLLEKLKEFLSDIKAYFKTIGDNPSREANALKDQLEGAVHYVDNIVKLFDKVALEAVENYQSTVATGVLNERQESTPSPTDKREIKENTQGDTSGESRQYVSPDQTSSNSLTVQSVHEKNLEGTGEKSARNDLQGISERNTEENDDKRDSLQGVQAEVKTTESENGYTVTDDAIGRIIKIKFEGKPSDEVRTILKNNAFVWNRTSGEWLRSGKWYGKNRSEDVIAALDGAYTNNSDKTEKNGKTTRTKKSDWSAHDVEWYLPGKKAPIAYSTVATRDLIEALAEQYPNATISQLLPAINYDEDAKKVVQQFIDAGYGDQTAYDWFVYDRDKKKPTTSTENITHIEEVNQNGETENADNERPILEPDTDGQRASRLLDESQAADVRGTSSERNAVGDTRQRESETSRDGDRTDADAGDSRSKGSSESGDIRRDGGLTEQKATSSSESLTETVEREIEQKSTESPKGNNFVIGDSLNLPDGEKARYHSNVAAIRLIKQLESEGRYATPTEQEILSKYVGWGALDKAFGEYRYNRDTRRSEMTAKDGWEKEFAELKSLVDDGIITEQEYKDMSASTKNAHYTSIEVIKAMYDGLAGLGFSGGRMLEPSSGVGNFVGAMPADMSAKVSSWTMVELDRITGLIAKYLYPNSDVRIQGFENANIPDNYMDVAIGNVPFGNFGVVDRAYPKRITKAIHNYFFAKSIDKVRPGGIVMFITSSFTMNSNDTTVRKYIMERADLLGAIRLPNTAFKGNAGTEVVTDILILKKRESGTDYAGEDFLSADYDSNYGTYTSNYFKSHPEMVLGKPVIKRGMYGANTLTFEPFTDRGSIDEQIRKAFKNIKGKMSYPSKSSPEKTNFALEKATKKAKSGGFVVHSDGSISRNENGQLVKYDTDEKTAKRIAGMLEIRDAYKKLANYLQQGVETKYVKQARTALNTAYDSFVKEFGYINSPANRKAIDSDPDSYSILSLENYDTQKKIAKKADIFAKDTISANKTVTHVDTVEEGVIASINLTGGVDASFIAKLTSKTVDDVTRDIIDSRLAFKTRSGALIARESYLSGNVRAKLREAEALAPYDQDFNNNVEELKKVIPADIPYNEIYITPGATFIPNEVYADFIAHMLGGRNNQGYGSPDVEVGRTASGEFKIILNNKRLKNGYYNTQTWGTARKSFLDLIDAMMGSRTVRVNDVIESADGKKVSVINEAETEAANEKVKAIQKEFEDWLWKDENRRTALARLYNETFNAIVNPRYDGSHLSVNGISADYALREHQANAVHRIIASGGNTLLAHRVGAGKTLEMAAAAMKMRELGVIKKPVFVVPKSVVAQWGVEFHSYFPAARLLVADDKSFTPANRKIFTNKIANGDYDAVIVSYEQFEKIPMSAEYQQSFYEEQINEIIAAIAEEKAESRDGKGLTVKEMEKKKAQLEKKLKELTSKPKDENNVDFEMLGIDSLFVDEAHNFKNLEYVSRMSNVAGLGSAKGSQRAFDLYTKIRYLQGLNGGRGVVFATATPVMNSMVELYIMQRYLQPDVLNQLGLKSFDAWAKQFGEVVNKWEINPSGTGMRQKQVFANFRNLNELQLLFRSFADVLTEVPGLKIPKMKGGAVKIIECEPGEFQKAYMQELQKRAENVKNVDPAEDNMLKITSDGRKVSYTQRMIDPTLPYEPDCKIFKASENIFKEYQDSADIKGTQIVFLDMATPKGTDKNKTETNTDNSADDSYDEESARLYEDMRDYLVKKGIPKREISFIHEADSDAKRKQLFENVNNGKVRVLIGSTGKMGVGMNAQKRVVAIHHLDAPWRPGDVEQRDGRAFRQKNINEEVSKYVYVTKGSFDSRLWDILDRKQHFINQIMNGEDVGRTAEDTGEVTLSAAEVKALASGNPLIEEQTKLTDEIKKLENLQKAYNSSIRLAKAKFADDETKIANYKNRIARIREDIAARVDTYSEGKFSMTVGNQVFSEKKDAGVALAAAISAKTNIDAYVTVGTFAGFELRAIKSGAEYHGSIQGKENYKFNVYLNNTTRMVNHIGEIIAGFENMIMNSEQIISDLSADRDAQQHIIAQPFEKQNELNAKRARFNEVMELLAPKSEEQLGKTDDNTVQEQSRDYLEEDYENGDIRLLGRRYGTHDGRSGSGDGTKNRDDQSLSSIKGGRQSESGSSLPLSDSEGREISSEILEKIKDSKVVDSDGKPLVLYHYTPYTDFTEISQSNDVGFHSGTIEQAIDRSKNNDGRIFRNYYNLKAPLSIRLDIGAWKAQILSLYLYAEGYISESENTEIEKLSLKDRKQNYSSPASVRLREILASYGYDGVAYPNGVEGNGLSYIAFYKEQIITTEIMKYENGEILSRENVQSQQRTDTLTNREMLETEADNDTVQDQSRSYLVGKQRRKSKVPQVDEFSTYSMQWARSDKTEIGEQKLFYRNGKWVLLEKSDSGFVEMGTFAADRYNFIKKEIDIHNEELHDRGNDERIYRSALRYENLGSSDSRNNGDDVGEQADNGQAGELYQAKSVGNRSTDNEKGESNNGNSLDLDEQNQQRTVTLTDREVLELAANEIDVSDLTQAEKDALTIFQDRLSNLKDLQSERAEQGKLYKEQQFGEKVNKDAATETLNRMHVLDSKIRKATAELLTVEEKDVLKRVLQKARKVVEVQVRQHDQEILKRWRDRRDNAAAIKKYRERLHGDVNELSNWIVNPSNKDIVKHVPDVLKNTVIPFLTSINFTSKRALKGGEATKADAVFTARLEKLNAALKTNIELTGLYSGYNDLPPNFMENLQNFINSTNALVKKQSGDFVINLMTSEELKELSQIVRTLKKYITQINRFHYNAMFEHVYEAGENSIQHLKELGSAGNTGTFSAFLLWQQIRPAYAFERFGKGGEAIYDELRRGQATLAFNTKEIQEFTERTYTEKEVKAWENEIKTFTLGKDVVKMPVSYIMAFYELSKDPEALNHINGEGIRVATYTHNGKKISDTGHIITVGELNQIIGSLTDRQKEVADALQKYMSEQGGKWGNYVSVARFGEELFTNKRYFPINSDGRHLQANADESPSAASLYALLNMSFTKSRKEGANNRIVIYSIFDVFANHMASMAQYNAMALPILDALKWFNYQQVLIDDAGIKHVGDSVRERMDRAYGVPEETRPGKGKSGYAQDFVMNIIKAFNGTEAQGTPYDSLALKSLHRYNIAQVAYNLRVAIQQPLAITRAGMLVDYTSILKGMKLNPASIKKNIEEMQKYSGIAAWKSLGFYDVNISKGLTHVIKHDSSAMDKISDFGMWGAEKADLLTWAAIWSAAKEEVVKKQHLSPTSDGFYEAVTKLFEDIIYKTQVVDSVLTKNEFMRDKGAFARLISSFMSEPTTNASMLIDAYDKYALDIQRGMTKQQAWKKNRRIIGRRLYVYAVGAILLAAVQAAADALRDDDDYEEWYEKWLEAFGGNLVDELMPFNKLPILSDFYDLAKELLSIFGVDTYGNPPQSVFMQWYDSLIKGTEIIYEKISGEDTNYTWYGGIYKLLQAASGITGLPMASATREIITAWNNTVGAMAPSLKIATYEPSELSEIRYAYEDGYLTEKEATEQLLEKGLADTEDEAYFIIQGWEAGENYSRYDKIYDAVRNGASIDEAMNELTSHGYSKDEVVAQIKGEIGRWYRSGEISKQQATDMLTKYSNMDNNEIKATVSYWEYKKNNPDADVNVGMFEKYYSDIAHSGISINTYIAYRNDVKAVTGDDKKAKRMAVIDSLPITDTQKDTLYYAEGWSESKLYEAPWH